MASTPTDNFDFQNFYEATLSSDITSATLTIPLSSVPTPSEGILVINPDGASPEVIFYTSKGVNDVTCPADGRGWDSSSAQSWTDGTTVIMAPVGYMFRMLKNGIILPNNPPQGHMANGKISASVASNNITVAIKTLAGSDPSATDPVHVRIGNTVRTITSALSVTKNAGTNWMSLGSSEHATQDVDLFCYVGYNSTDGVTIGFSRIPYARAYGDFSATETNGLYCAISTITNAASTDEYELVGRFNATLSASASYNWSIPATPVVVSRPVYHTRWLSYTPSHSALTLGNGTQEAYYKIIDDELETNHRIIFGSTTSPGTNNVMTLPLPIPTKYTTQRNNVGIGIMCDITGASSPATFRFESTTTYRPIVHAAGGTYTTEAGITPSVPFTWATGDLHIANQVRYSLR